MKVEPVKYTPEVSQKLEQAAALDATWEECAFFAGISAATLYNWLESIKGLRTRLEALRNKPVLKARQTIISSLEVPKDAQWYLERKRKKEFGSNLDLTSDGKKIETPAGVITSPAVAQKIKELDEAMKAELEV